ncbi:60S ribosomal protein L28-1 like [Verticillium longisporum]|nr:60S ribosomal protein L28-1 like [Verticillium longisporum]
MAAQLPNVSQDLVWELTRAHNSFIVKRKGLGNSVIFSRDPYNLTNIHSKKHAGYAHDKSISIQAGENGAVQVVSKNEKKAQKPAEARNVTSFSQQTPARKGDAALL